MRTCSSINRYSIQKWKIDNETMAIKTGKATPKATRARKLERSFKSQIFSLSHRFDNIAPTPRPDHAV